MKNLLRELILPAFWLLILIVFSKNANKVKIKTENNAEQKLRYDIQSTGSVYDKVKNKTPLITKAVSSSEL